MYYCPYRNIYYEDTGELQYYSGGRGVMSYTPEQLEYIQSVDGNPHMSAVRIIGELKQQAAYWEAKAMEYKALLENMERVG